MRRMLPVALLLALGACAAKPEVKVATSINAYNFYEARYEETCTVAPKPDAVAPCAQTATDLKAWKKHLAEANTAVKLGGKCPLQLGLISADQKGVAKLWK